MVFQVWRQLSSSQKRVWSIGAGVLSFGAAIKFGYFYLSRSLIIDNLEMQNIDARKYLKESQEFGSWAAKDREKRTPKLTKEQQEQLQSYLVMMAKTNKDVYPTEGNEWRQGQK